MSSKNGLYGYINILTKLMLILLLNLNTLAYSGNQSEEDLKEETKNLMSRSISDNAPSLKTFKDIGEEYKWMVTISNLIEKNIPNQDERDDFLRSVHYEATRAGLDPLLVLALIKVESAFQKYAVSNADARGYMQVMPFWVKAIGEPEHNLFHMRTNLRYGCTILKHYIEKESGNMFMALGRYNGSRGKDTYPKLVLNSMMDLKRKIQ